MNQVSLVSISLDDGASAEEKTSEIRARVQRKDAAGATRDEEFKAWLVIGADGKNSKVREEMKRLSKHPPVARTLKRGTSFELLSTSYANVGTVAKTLRLPFAELEKVQPPFGSCMIRSESRRQEAKTWTSAPVFRMRPSRDSILLFAADKDHPLVSNAFKSAGELRAWLEKEYAWLSARLSLSDAQLEAFLASKTQWRFCPTDPCGSRRNLREGFKGGGQFLDGVAHIEGV